MRGRRFTLGSPEGGGRLNDPNGPNEFSNSNKSSSEHDVCKGSRTGDFPVAFADSLCGRDGYTVHTVYRVCKRPTPHPKSRPDYISNSRFNTTIIL